MKVSIKRHTVRGVIKYVVDISHEGKRKRKFFTSLTEAQAFDAVSWWSTIQKKEPVGSQTLLGVARDEYLKWYSEEYENSEKPIQKGLKTAEERVNRFLRWYGEGRPVVDVTVQDFKNYVNTGRLAAESRAGYGRAVKTFMFWCAKNGYGGDTKTWAVKTNPDLKVEFKKKFHKLPGILTPGQTKQLLNSIDPKHQTALAIMFFTGIRPEVEMSCLRFSDIQWGRRIGLMAERTKTGRERWIVPPENLWSWIPKKKIDIMPNYNVLTKARNACVKKLGFAYPSNAARHSFASYGYWKGLEWAFDIMGHINSETFLKNYKNNRVDAEDSKRYFSITRK